MLEWRKFTKPGSVIEAWSARKLSADNKLFIGDGIRAMMTLWDLEQAAKINEGLPPSIFADWLEERGEMEWATEIRDTRDIDVYIQTRKAMVVADFTSLAEISSKEGIELLNKIAGDLKLPFKYTGSGKDIADADSWDDEPDSFV